MTPLGTPQHHNSSNRPLNGMRYTTAHVNPLKRPRTPAIGDNGHVSGSQGRRDPKEELAAAEERKQAMRQHLYERSERMISKLFNKPANASRQSHDASDPQASTPPKDQSAAAPTPQTKKSARTIDEDDYGDEDDDEDEESTVNATPHPIKLAVTAPSTATPNASTLAAPSKPPRLEHGSTTSSNDHGKSSEEVRKKLEEDKKAAENAAKGSFMHTFYTLENDRDAMLEQQKLDELDRQVENEMTGQSGEAGSSARGGPGQNRGTLSSANLGASSLTLKHLISRIDAKRSLVSASDASLRSLMSEVRRNRSKWASEDKIGQEELYEAAERVLMELKAMTDYAAPFLQKVNKRDAPDYYRVITEPMDIGTMIKKLKGLSYKSKREFCRDLDLIWANCLTYNAEPNHFLRKKAEHMRKETSRLTPLIPDIIIRDRAEVEAEERRAQFVDEDDDDSDDQPIVASRGRKAPAKKSTKGVAPARKAPHAPSETSPGPEHTQRTASAGPSGHLHASRQDQLRSDGDTMMNGSTTPPPGNGTPLDVAGQSETGAPSQMDLDDVEGVSTLSHGPTGAHLEELDEEDEEYKTWKQVTKKDRARVAAERHRLFKQDKINNEEPALLRTRAGMRRWLRQQQTLVGDDASPEGAEVNIEPGNEESAGGATLAEDMDVDDENGLPDYYDPLSSVPYVKDRLRWTEDSEGQVIDQREDCLRLLSKGYFMAPESSLNTRTHSNMKQMQDTRKVVAKISIVKQMQLQSQASLKTYQNQFQKYDPAPFDEEDAEPQVVSSDDPSMSPWICREALKRSVGKIFYHAGFEEFQPAALDVATEMAGDYFSKLVKTFGVYREMPQSFEDTPVTESAKPGPIVEPNAIETSTPSKKRPIEATTIPSKISAQPAKRRKLKPRFTREEEVVHALNENSMDIDSLQSYIDDDVMRLGGKLTTQHQRVKDYLAELLRPALDPATTGVDGVGAFTDGSESQFVAGDFAEDIDEDFFGFKELGLDVEFGISASSVPLHLLQSRFVRNSAYQPNGATVQGENVNIIEPPPPYAPVTASDIPQLIGLVQDFFREKLEKSDGDVVLEDDDLPRKERFPKPRLPPSGKISSPRKRPIREQQQMARRKKKAEIEASREMERLKEAELNGGLDITASAGNTKEEPVSANQVITTTASGALHVKTLDEDPDPTALSTGDKLPNGNPQPADNVESRPADEEPGTPDTPTRQAQQLASLNDDDLFKLPEETTNGTTDPEKKQLSPPPPPPQSSLDAKPHSSSADAEDDDDDDEPLAARIEERKTPNGTNANINLLNGDSGSGKLPNGISDKPAEHAEKQPTEPPPNVKEKSKTKASPTKDRKETDNNNPNDADTDGKKILSPSESVPIAAH
ncbi:MAG: Transcriptional activator spt7 [Chrysothrix sp. TS-e1954]|nr:MAG: Transcriptional activator spt7 [Chrysothrix sp. TS-e1954]